MVREVVPKKCTEQKREFREGGSKVKVTQSCPTLCNPMDYTVHEFLQARILEWIAFPSPGDLPNPGIEPRSPALLVDSLLSEPPGKLVKLQLR